jgi:signal transduction histidine kinase
METPPLWSLANLTDGQSLLGPPQVPDSGEAFGYHSAKSSTADSVKWVQVDLGESMPIEQVVLFPTTREIASSPLGLAFPVRFRVEVSDQADFSQRMEVFSCENEDYPSPGLNPVRISKAGIRGRYVRLTATQLYQRFFDYALILGELQVWSQGKNRALHQPVSFRDKYEDHRYRAQYLVDGLNGPHRIVDIAPWLKALSERRVLLGEWRGLQLQSQAWSDDVNLALEKGALVAVPLLLFTVSMAWVLSLRREVARQTALVGAQLQAQAASDERARIARDMHDTVGARLTQVSLLQELALAEPTLSAAARDKLQNSANSTHEVVQVMDEIVWSLNPRHDTLRALVNYLGYVQREYLEPLGMDCRQEIPTDIPSLAVISSARHHILSMVKECFQNSAKHSGASRLLLHVDLVAKDLIIRICDNGQLRVHAAHSAHGHNGLSNLQERATALNGSFLLTLTPVGGEALITLPLTSLS